jgi:hypothetical protein
VTIIVRLQHSNMYLSLDGIGQRGARQRLQLSLAELVSKSIAPRCANRQRLRLLERQNRPPKGRAVPGLRPDGYRAAPAAIEAPRPRPEHKPQSFRSLMRRSTGGGHSFVAIGEQSLALLDQLVGAV